MSSFQLVDKSYVVQTAKKAKQISVGCDEYGDTKFDYGDTSKFPHGTKSFAFPACSGTVGAMAQQEKERRGNRRSPMSRGH